MNVSKNLIDFEGLRLGIMELLSPLCKSSTRSFYVICTQKRVGACGLNEEEVESPSSAARENVRVCTYSKTARNLLELRLCSPES